jgi:hypothetical protein
MYMPLYLLVEDLLPRIASVLEHLHGIDEKCLVSGRVVVVVHPGIVL